MNVKLTDIKRYTTNRDGTPLVTKKGNPYERVVIQTAEHRDKALSGFGNATTTAWRVGDQVEIDVEINGEYLNFSVPKQTNGGNTDMKEPLRALWKHVDERFDRLENLIQSGGTDKMPWEEEKEEEIPVVETEPVNTDGIPF